MDFEEKKKKIEEIMKRFYQQLAQFKKAKMKLFEELEKEATEEEIKEIKKEIEELTKQNL